MKAIVYYSNTGSTKEYAEMISNATGIPNMSLKEAKKNLSKDDDIIFMGCIFANMISKYTSAKKLFNIKAVCGCGLSLPNSEQVAKMPLDNMVGDTPFFYLQGNFDINKLKGIKKFMMNKMMSMALKSEDPKQIEFGTVLKNGGHFVSERNIQPVVEFIKNQKTF